MQTPDWPGSSVPVPGKGVPRVRALPPLCRHTSRSDQALTRGGRAGRGWMRGLSYPFTRCNAVIWSSQLSTASLHTHTLGPRVRFHHPFSSGYEISMPSPTSLQRRYYIDNASPNPCDIPLAQPLLFSTSVSLSLLIHTVGPRRRERRSSFRSPISA